MCFLSNKIAGCFCHQNLPTEWIDTEFFTWENHRRKDLRVPFLVWCCWLCFLSSQIAGLFDHQYFCKESIDTVVLLHETVSGRKGLKLPFLFGCGQLGLLSNQTEEYSDHQQLWNESMNTLDFFCVEITIKRRNYLRVLRGLVRLMDSLIIYLSGRSKLLSQIFCMGRTINKERSGSTTFGCVLAVSPVLKSDCRILSASMSFEGINWYLKFLAWR